MKEKRMMKHAAITLTLVGVLAFAGCAPNFSPTAYQPHEVGQPAQVYHGTVVQKKLVHVEGTRSGKGLLAGAILGAVAGSALGGDTEGRIAGGAIGSVVGGTAGHVAEQQLTEQNAFQYLIRLTNGRTISVVQGLTPELHVGDKVRVIVGDRVRVLRR